MKICKKINQSKYRIYLPDGEMDPEFLLKTIYTRLSPYLDERQKRYLAAIEAEICGRGGVTRVSSLTGMSRSTINIGRKELREGKILSAGRVIRRFGAGRKRKGVTDSRLIDDLEAIIEPAVRPDTLSPLRWTCLSTRKIAQKLKETGHDISHTTVASILSDQGYRLQTAKKTFKEKSCEKRRKQFELINEYIALFQDHRQPIISLDCLTRDITVSSETGERSAWSGCERGCGGMMYLPCDFIIEHIRRWWGIMGRERYPDAWIILVIADSDGSDPRERLVWNDGLKNLSGEIGLEISFCHFPSGTSRWTRIEQTFSSTLSQRWADRSGVDFKISLNLIGDTSSEGSDRLETEVHTGKPGPDIHNGMMDVLRISSDNIHSDWNYTMYRDQ